MDGDQLRAVIDDLAALHRGGASGREAHEVLLRVRPHHEKAFAFAVDLAPDPDPAVRAARADVLGEVGNGDPDFVDRVLPALTEMAAGESEPMVIASLAAALGSTWDPRATPPLVRWADHPDDDVRLEVASSLGGTMSNDADPAAVAALIGLTRDPVPAVRDWATFGLGNSAVDGSEVEQALLDRIVDEDADTRAEAFMALAERGDDRIVEPLVALLSGDSIGTLEVRAAGKLADVRFHPPLVAVAAWWGEEDRDVIEHAIGRCDPGLRAVAVQTEHDLVNEVADQLRDRGIDGVVVAVEGAYPATEIVVTWRAATERSGLWSYDDAHPLSLDHEFTVRRVVNLAASLFTRSKEI